MGEFTCASCEEDFDPEDGFPWGDDVKCLHCGTWLSTDAEESWDRYYGWVTGVADDQTDDPCGNCQREPWVS